MEAEKWDSAAFSALKSLEGNLQSCFPKFIAMDYADYLKRGEWKHYSLALYPEPPPAARLRLGLAFCTMMVLGIVAGYLTGYFMSCFLAALIITVYLYSKIWPLRCPKCKGRVLTRIEDSKRDGQDYQQFFHDCPNCQITWIDKKTRVSDS